MPSSRLTSVPVRRRAVGWVTSPPGFETTSRCASSNTMGTGGPSPTSATSSATSTTTCSPPSKRNDFALGRPSTKTLPSAIARWASARLEPVVAATTASSRPATATNRSRGIVGRSRGSPGRALVPEGCPREDHRPDHDRAVGDVEDRPPVKIDEVDNVPGERGAAEGAIGEVAERAAQDEAEPDGGHGVPRSERRADDQRGHDQGRPGEQPRRPLTEAEGTHTVGRVPQRERPRDQ